MAGKKRSIPQWAGIVDPDENPETVHLMSAGENLATGEADLSLLTGTVVEGINFAETITPFGSSTPLTLIGAGRRDVRLPNGIVLKVSCLGIYAVSKITRHLGAFQANPQYLLAGDDLVEAFLAAPVVKMARVSFLVDLSGEEYAEKAGEMTEAALKRAKTFGEDEQQALDDFAKFLKPRQFTPGSSLFISLSEQDVQMSTSSDSNMPRESEVTFENRVFGAGLISTMISIDGVSPSTRISFIEGILSLLRERNDVWE